MFGIMDVKVEQWCAIKFCMRLGKLATETVNRMKVAYECTSDRTIYWWHKEFLVSESHTAWWTTLNIDNRRKHSCCDHFCEGSQDNHYKTSSAVVSAVCCSFKRLPQEELEKTVLIKWKQRMQQCIASKDCYLEKEAKLSDYFACDRG